jgi:hypothetical protein
VKHDFSDFSTLENKNNLIIANFRVCVKDREAKT